ncbi:hypothetical protein [Bradyrhizobium sp. AZCC 2289]|uniref:hypothetical protein n=1 Tax=Bradyrhizobium sp. AZCC 2289 TaxID=3117026 RepID=UPI002FF1AE73
MPISQKLMVEAGLRLLEQGGYSIIGAVEGAHHRATVKRVAGGSTVQVRTCNLPQLPMVFTEKEVLSHSIPDRVSTALTYDYVLAVIPATLTTVSAFLIPSRTVRDYVLTQLDLGLKDLSPHLNQKLWQTYRLPGSIDVSGLIEETEDGKAESGPPLTKNDVEGSMTLRDRIEQHRTNIARDAGVTSEKVRIEIDFS